MLQIEEREGRLAGNQKAVLGRIVFDGQKKLIVLGHRDFLDMPAEQSASQLLHECGDDNTV